MRTVLLTGITSCESRGVEALVRALTQQLQSWADTQVIVLTQTPDLDAAALADTEAACVADPFVVSRSWRRLRPAETSAELSERREQLLTPASLVVATGGDLHTPDYGVSTPYLRVLIAAQERKIPTAMLGQSVGPFSNAEETAAFSSVAAACDLLTVREDISHQYLVRQLGLAAEHVRLSADPAFLLRPADQERVRAILSSAGLDPRQPYTCVAPSQGVTRYSPITGDGHLSALQHLVKRLWAVHKAPVILVPHCHDSREHNDDRILARRIAAGCADVPVHVLDANYNAAEYKAVLGDADLVVSERLHASIGALSSGTPAVAIGHSHKFHGVLGQVYGDLLEQGPLHFDVARFTTDTTVSDRIAGLDAAALRIHLARRLPHITALAAGDIRLLRTLLNP